MPALYDALTTSDDATLRAEAAWALGRIRNGKAIELLKQATNDRSVHVRKAAAEALANIGAKGALVN
mgnify:CR=1 FL=1